MIINSYFTNRGISSPRKQIPKLLIYLFLSFNFFFGFDYGFTEWIQNRKLRISVKIIQNLSAVVHASILAVCVIDVENVYSLWFGFNFLHYLMCFFVLLSTKYNLYTFSNDVYGLLGNCMVTRNNRVVAILILCLFAGSFVKILAFVIECVLVDEKSFLDCKLNVVPLYLYILPCISVDVIPLVLVTSYYYMNIFLTCLKEAYIKSEISLDCLEKNYLAIMDCFDKIKPFYDNLLMVELINNIPKIMGLVYSIQLYVITEHLENKIIWIYAMGEASFCVHIALQFFLPALSAEMTFKQLDSLRLYLHKQLLKETDQKHNLEIMRFLRYVEAQYQHKTWRIIPVSMSLPLFLINFCTTYTIVLIQLNHMYDK